MPESTPFVGPLPPTTAKVSASPSTSLPVSVIATAVSSEVETLCPFATGGLLAGVPPPVPPSGPVERSTPTVLTGSKSKASPSKG